MSELTAHKQCPSDHSQSERPESSVSGGARHFYDNDSIGDQLYAEGYFVGTETPLDNKKLSARNQEARTHIDRLNFLTMKHKKEQEEAYKQLRARAKDIACLEELQKSNPEGTTYHQVVQEAWNTQASQV